MPLLVAFHRHFLSFVNVILTYLFYLTISKVCLLSFLHGVILNKYITSNVSLLSLCPRPALAKGVMQLYSVEQQKSQPLEAHAAAFASLKFAGKDAPSTVISFAQKTLKDGAVISKLHVIELGVPGGKSEGKCEGGEWVLSCCKQRVGEKKQWVGAWMRMLHPGGGW